MIADLDTLLIALYVELADRIIPSLGFTRSGPGKPPEVTDAELVCLAVAQVLLRYDDERHWLRAAASRVGHLFPRLLGQSEYNQRLTGAARLMEAALRWLADQTPATAEMLRLMDATPVPCGQSVITAKRSDLFGWAGYGYCPSHSRWYWGSKLLLICTCEGTVTGFALANPKLAGEREQARTMLEHQPANRPAPGTAIVTDKGLSGEDTEAFFAGPDLGLTLIRPARSRRYSAITAASPASDLAPESTSPSRQALIAFGLTGTTGWPASSSRSTSRPFGRSMATCIPAGSPNLARRRISSAIPSAVWAMVNWAAILPSAFITHTAWFSAAQSIPVKNFASHSASGTSAPQGGSDDPARRTATGRSLTGALRRVSLLPVRVPAEARGGGVLLAVFRRPTQTVTPAPAESLQRAP